MNESTYISKHLQHELRLFLSAVELWRLLKEKDSGFVVNIARDSAVVHFRTILKFFTEKENKDDRSITEFGISEPYESDYKIWLGKINEAVLHISPERINPKNRPEEDLNDQMNNFRVEIIRLWQLFINDSPKYAPFLHEALNQGNKEVSNDITRIKNLLEKDY